MKSFFELRCVSDLDLEQVFYILNEKNTFVARIYKSCGLWRVWYYYRKYGILRNRLDEALASVERYYQANKDEILGEL